MRSIMKHKGIDSLESLRRQALENGVEFIACQMSMDVMGVKKEELLDEITIGGCRAGVIGGSTVADDTLDTRLEAQREWFLENSGMSVIL